MAGEQSVDAIRCFCGEAEIEHSHGNNWKCQACGRFHDGKALDLLADKTRMLQSGTDHPGINDAE